MTKEQITFELKKMPNGWWKAFGDILTEELWDVLVKTETQNFFFITEVKEKWGMLRVYFDEMDGNVPEEIYCILDKYEFISAHVCMYCGKPDVGVTDGWIIPICKNCYDKIIKGNYYEDVNISHARIPDYYVRSWINGHKKNFETYYIKNTVNEIRRRYIE